VAGASPISAARAADEGSARETVITFTGPSPDELDRLQDEADRMRDEAEARAEAMQEAAEARAEAMRDAAEAQAEALREQAEARAERMRELSEAQAEQVRGQAERARSHAGYARAQAEYARTQAELQREVAAAQRELAMADLDHAGHNLGKLKLDLRGLEGPGRDVGAEVGRAMDEAFSPENQARLQREMDRAMQKLADRRSWSWSSGWSKSEGRDWYSKGMELHRKEKFQQAIEAFQKAIENDQRADDATYNIACGYARLGDVPKAIEWLKKAQEEGFDVAGSIDHDDDFDDVRDDPKFKEARRELRRSRGQAEAKAALRKLERVEAKKPKDAGPWSSAGLSLLEAGEYDAAARAFAGAAERAQSKGSYLYNEACALAQKGDKGRALDVLEKAIAEGFDDASHMRRDDDLEPLRGEARFKDLLAMARALEFPGHLRWQVGPFRHTKGGADGELERLQEAAKKYDKYGRPFHNLGYALLSLGKYAEAQEAFGQALAKGYRPATTLYNLACAAAQQEHKEAALDYLKKAIEAGFSDWEQMKGDDDLEALHGDAKFRALVRQSRELSYAQEDGE
jgi:tetratricopeptide (TPR) repeat protein